MRYLYICVCILILFPAIGFSQLDTSFNHTGKLIDSMGVATKIFVQKNDKIILQGIIKGYLPYASYMARVNPNGSIDKSFANNGFYYKHGALTGLRMVNDECIYLSSYSDIYWKPGYDSEDFTLLKLDSNGNTDYGFGDNGAVTTDVAHWHYQWLAHSDDVPSDLIVLPNGKIVMYGMSFGEDLVWVRYNPDGSIDHSFGETEPDSSLVPTGIASFYYPLLGYLEGTNDMALLPDGRIVSGFMGSDASCMGAIRLLPDGNIDSTFGVNGIAGYQEGWLTYCTAMCLQPDGKVLLAGYANTGIVVRFDSTGKLDTTFGQNGVVHIPNDAVQDMALTPSGKIVLAGYADSSFEINRLLPNGAFDLSFADSGVLVSRPDATGECRAYCVALQKDGKILVGGEGRHKSQTNVWDNFILVRYLPDGKPFSEDSSLLSDGKLTIYPNPAGRKLWLKWTGKAEKDVRVKIYDMQGRKILSYTNLELRDSPLSMDISSLAGGVYWLQVSNPKGLFIEEKFVKK